MESNTTLSVPIVKSSTVSKRRKIRWGDALAPYLFISPFLISFIVLFLVPGIYSFVLSFYRYKGYGDATFIGLANYQATLEYHVFWEMLRNTVTYWLIHTIPMMAIAFGLAVLVRSRVVRGKSFFKPIIFLPNIVAIVAASLIFQNFFGTQYGVINNLFGTQIPWLQDFGLAKLAIAILIIWRNTGFWFVVFLAGLTSINPEVEEAAIVDGANSLNKLAYITIPLMRNIFLFAFVIDAIGSFQLFTEPNVMMARNSGLAPVEVAPLVNLLVVNMRSGNFGQASAVGWILFILIAVASLTQIRIFRTGTKETES